MSYKIGVIGHGVVGRGMARLFGEVTIYDPDTEYYNLTKRYFKSLNLAIICVPTNTSSDGCSADTSIVFETLRWLDELCFSGVVLIKSTTPPSHLMQFKRTFTRLRIVFSPEYMGESKYFTPFWKYPDPSDMSSHTFQIFGGDRADTSFCVDVFKRKMSVDTVFHQTDIATASLCKYMENSFFALKVTFCNEWFDIARSYGVDYNELRECWLLDPRINRNHTIVFPDNRGYGGKCFPKDVKAIIADSGSIGFSTELLKAIDRINEKTRRIVQ